MVWKVPVPCNIFDEFITIFGSGKKLVHIFVIYTMILLKAARDDGETCLVGNKTITIDRAQYVVRLRSIADVVGIGKDLVSKYLDKLVSTKYLTKINNKGITIVTVVNYHKITNIGDPNFSETDSNRDSKMSDSKKKCSTDSKKGDLSDSKISHEISGSGSYWQTVKLEDLQTVNKRDLQTVNSRLAKNTKQTVTETVNPPPNTPLILNSKPPTTPIVPSSPKKRADVVVFLENSFFGTHEGKAFFRDYLKIEKRDRKKNGLPQIHDEWAWSQSTMSNMLEQPDRLKKAKQKVKKYREIIFAKKKAKLRDSVCQILDHSVVAGSRDTFHLSSQLIEDNQHLIPFDMLDGPEDAAEVQFFSWLFLNNIREDKVDLISMSQSQLVSYQKKNSHDFFETKDLLNNDKFFSEVICQRAGDKED